MSHDDRSILLLCRVDQLCEHFERALQRGCPPQLEAYLAAVAAEVQPALLQELLQLDVDYRRAAGQGPTAADYAQLPDRFASIVAAVLAASRPALRAPGPAQYEGVGPREDTVSASGDKEAQRPSRRQRGSPRVRLEVQSASAGIWRLEFADDDAVLVGRDSACHLAVTGDESLSRFHCLLEIQLPACYVRDLNSQGGTYVNGEKIFGITPLTDGDVVSCGQVRMKIRIATAAGAAATLRRAMVRANSQANVPQGAPDFHLEHSPQFFPGYELTRKIGKGGMGLVYLAQASATSRQVALKVIVPEWAFDEEASRRFLREVSAIARLRHRRIVEFLEAGWIEGHLFLAMEYVDQIDVAAELARRTPAMRVKLACGLACQVLEGLRYAHGQSWVHRDLKPANILVGRFDGRLRAKIADFGLAKNSGLASQAGVTQSGQALGTLPFMAPEQFENARAASPAMDIYSLGATLYFWLAGSPPLQLNAERDPASMILHGAPPPIGQRVPGLPEEVGAIVHQALAKNPADRFASADAMWRRLAPYARGARSSSSSM
jgi:hypothetical protein